MRRALTAFLILSLLGGQMGMFGALLGRYHAQKSMQQEIAAASASPSERAEIEHLTISRSELQSPNSSFVRVDEREFWYRDHLYDIVHEEWRNDGWHVWVLQDREEQQYLNALAQTINPPALEGSSVPVQHRPIASQLSATTPTALASLPVPLLRSQAFPRFSPVGHQAPYLEVPHPPPWG